ELKDAVIAEVRRDVVVNVVAQIRAQRRARVERAPRDERCVAQNQLRLWTVERPTIALVDDAIAVEIDVQILLVDGVVAIQIGVDRLSVLHLVLVHEERIGGNARFEYLNQAADTAGNSTGENIWKSRSV